MKYNFNLYLIIILIFLSLSNSSIATSNEYNNKNNNNNNKNNNNIINNSNDNNNVITTSNALLSTHNKINNHKEKPKVFIVHGHHNVARENVSKLLKKMEFEPVVLFERPNNGFTIIEKLEKEISGCKFGIVIMSGDNIAFTKKENSSELTEIAYPRLNVIFEFGYLVGKFGRSNVIYLYVPYKGKLENYDLPSDLLGYVWINYTDDLIELENEINIGNYKKI
ncbi:hypothetical protein RB653_009601 [Dictyostelium firmibasis]|uniref:TIR domain-containing protein n=1 Tax=Dictyostelium firmibasis TaxID=79012 RepID=A0AAN7U1F7_9MYCE